MALAKGVRYNCATGETEEYVIEDFVPQEIIEESQEPTKEEVIVQGMATMMIENETMKQQIKDMSLMIEELMKGSVQ